MDPATKRYIDDRFAALKKDLTKEIGLLIDAKMAGAERRLEETVKESVSAGGAGGAGAGAETNNDKQLMAMNKAINMRVSECVREMVAPQINELKRFVEYRTQDESELLGSYRSAVMKSSDKKMLTNGNDKMAFQTSMFAFTDED